MLSATISERQFEIIQAAGKMLSSAGVSGLTIKNLAKEMGFAESAVYRHFESKEAIILAMLGYLSENMEERLSNVVSRTKNPRENLEAIFKAQFIFFEQHPHFVVAVFSDGLLESSTKVNAAILRIIQVKMNHLMPVVMEGQQQGFFTNGIPAEALVHIIMGSFRLQMFKWYIANFQFDLSERGQDLLSNILKIIQPCKS